MGTKRETGAGDGQFVILRGADMTTEELRTSRFLRFMELPSNQARLVGDVIREFEELEARGEAAVLEALREGRSA